jgi:hypothetical protein
MRRDGNVNGRQPPPENGGEKGFGYGPEGINKMPVSREIVSPYPWQFIMQTNMLYGFKRKDMPLIISDSTLEEWIARYERHNRHH